MYNCDICNREIEKGQRVIDNGIKYICFDKIGCANELDNLKKTEQQELSKLGPDYQCTNCEKYSQDFRIIESIPPKIICKLCNKSSNNINYLTSFNQKP